MYNNNNNNNSNNSNSANSNNNDNNKPLYIVVKKRKTWHLSSIRDISSNSNHNDMIIKQTVLLEGQCACQLDCGSRCQRFHFTTAILSSFHFCEKTAVCVSSQDSFHHQAMIIAEDNQILNDSQYLDSVHTDP